MIFEEHLYTRYVQDQRKYNRHNDKYKLEMIDYAVGATMIHGSRKESVGGAAHHSRGK